MNDKDAEDIYLDNVLEVNNLWNALSELIYVTTHNEARSDFRIREARREFGKSLAKLGLIKRRRHGKANRETHS